MPGLSALQVSNMYFSQKYNQNPEPHKWTQKHIEGLVHRAKGKEEFSYGAETHYLYNVFDLYPVSGKHGVVLGTEMPWLEAILLSKGEPLEDEGTPGSMVCGTRRDAQWFWSSYIAWLSSMRALLPLEMSEPPLAHHLQNGKEKKTLALHGRSITLFSRTLYMIRLGACRAADRFNLDYVPQM